MINRLGVAAFAAGMVALSGLARADCEPMRGDSQVATVAKGMSLRVMYLRPGPYNNYFEVCTRTATAMPWAMAAGEFANASDWYELWRNELYATAYEINFWGGYVTDADPLPWPGVRRTATPFGFTLAYFGMDMTATMPNTLVEVCILADLGKCPVH